MAAQLPAAAVARLAAAVLRAERSSLHALSITFVGPARIRSLNRRFLRRDRVTDVIAFTLGARPSSRDSDPLRPLAPGPVGDVYICPAAAERQAKLFDTTPRDELRRLVVHGILHVLGYDHPEGDDRTDSPMWRRQERHLKALAR